MSEFKVGNKYIEIGDMVLVQGVEICEVMSEELEELFCEYLSFTSFYYYDVKNKDGEIKKVSSGHVKMYAKNPDNTTKMYERIAEEEKKKIENKEREIAYLNSFEYKFSVFFAKPIALYYKIKYAIINYRNNR